MKNKILLNKNSAIDRVKLLQSRMVILANSGAGKSYAIRKFAEEACSDTQVIIIDPEGEFASLREKYDFILAGRNADVPAETRSAALFATRLLELGKSAIIDLYELHPQERQRYVKLFFDAMINAPKELYHPVFIVLDEAHEYAPEGKPSEATWAVEAMASKGRKRGFCLIPASQRISKLSKNVSAECNNKLIGRASQDIDMKRAGDELGFTKERMKELRQLAPGEFFAFGPAISDEIQKIKIGPVKTTHAKVGYYGANKVPPPSNVIKKILAEIKDIPAEAEQEAKSIAELKKENAELKRNLTVEKQRKTDIGKTVIDLDAIDKAVKATEIKLNTVFKKERDALLKQAQNYFNALVKIRDDASGWSVPQLPKNDLFIIPVDQHIKVKITATANPENTLKIGSPLGKGEKEILMAIAQHEGATTEHIAVLTGYKQTSRRVYLQRLSAAGFIEKENDTYVATDIGRDALGDFKPLPIGADLLIEHYKLTLPEGERKIFDALLLSHPDAMNREDLQRETNYKTTSIRVYVQRLMARKIIEQDGSMLRLTDKLFETR